MKILLFVLISFSSALNNSLSGQYYSRIRLYEYVDYTDVTFFKFNIDGPTTLANWSVIIHTDGKCSNYPVDIHFALQHEAYPLIAPKNESFPDMYITTRHDLFTWIFNQTVSNVTVQLTNPLIGTWFAMGLIERLSKISSSSCNISLTTWLDYRAEAVLLTLTLNQPLQIVLSNNLTSVYLSYFTKVENSRLSLQSEWTSACDVNIRVRINGLPSSVQYDYQTVCKNGPCGIEIDQLTAFLWIYLQISVNSSSCLQNLVPGSIIARSTECSTYSNDVNCIPSFSTRRVMFSSYYEFAYIPEYSNSSTTTIVLNDSSIYSYQFLVDDRNIGGTIHLDFQTEMKSVSPLYTNVSILACLSKNRARRYSACGDSDYRFSIDQNSSTVRSLPYPEMAQWYLTFELSCTTFNNACPNTSTSLTFQISSSPCTREQCGTYGTCQIMTSQQNIFSVCTCVAGYRGYGCTDSQHNHVFRYLPSVLFLTLSNLMFVPAVGLAIYYRLYIEALVYFFNMFFSTFYHACDQEIRRFCIFKYDGLQLSDFVGSYSSFVITVITMALVPRSIKAFLFMLGLLICIILNSRDRFNSLQLLILIIIMVCFTILTWIVVSIRKRRLQPTLKQLLISLPGIALAITGVVLFAFFETDDNYWYIHSLWHIFMATAILFLLPQRIKQKKEKRTSTESNTSNPQAGAINEGTTAAEDEIDNRPPAVITNM